MKRRSLLTGVRARILAAYDTYDSSRGNPELVAPLRLQLEEAKALKSNFDLVDRDRSLADVRHSLLAAADLELCPMCGRGHTSSLDHYLPKDVYPEFSILPLNLVPVCDLCNRRKSNLVGSAASGRFFHSYYDTVPGIPILECTVSVGDTVITEFNVSSQLTPDDLRLNAQFQFDKLGLGPLYSASAAVELTERFYVFAEAYLDGQADAVSDEAARNGRNIRRQLGAQSWKVALYEGLSKSSEFCNEGFRVIRSYAP